MGPSHPPIAFQVLGKPGGAGDAVKHKTQTQTFFRPFFYSESDGGRAGKGHIRTGTWGQICLQVQNLRHGKGFQMGGRLGVEWESNGHQMGVKWASNGHGLTLTEGQEKNLECKKVESD